MPWRSPSLWTGEDLWQAVKWCVFAECVFLLLKQRKSYVKRAGEGRKGLDLFPASLQVGLSGSNLCIPWDESLLLTPLPTPHLLIRVPFLFCLPLSRVKVLLGLEALEHAFSRTKKLPKNWGVKSPPSLGPPAPAWELPPGDWEQLSVCCLKGTHSLRIFS